MRDGMMSSMRQSKFTKVNKITSTSIHTGMEPSLRQLNKHYLNLDLASKLTPFFPHKNRISSSSLNQLTTFRDSKRKLWLVTLIKPTIAMETQIKILLVFIHLSKLNQVTQNKRNQLISSTFAPKSRNSNSPCSSISTHRSNQRRLLVSTLISESKSLTNNLTYLICKLRQSRICWTLQLDRSLV